MKLKNKTVTKTAVKPTIKQKAIAAAKTVVKAVQKVYKTATGVFAISGHRGTAFRLCEFYTDDKGVMHVRAIQERDPKTGVFKSLKDAKYAQVVDGCLTGDKEAKTALASYMNGGCKCNTAKIAPVSKKQLDSLPKAHLKFQQHEQGLEVRYAGNPNTKSVSGIVTSIKGVEYFWHAEQDRNVHNKHERTEFSPLKKGAKLLASKV